MWGDADPDSFCLIDQLHNLQQGIAEVWGTERRRELKRRGLEFQGVSTLHYFYTDTRRQHVQPGLPGRITLTRRCCCSCSCCTQPAATCCWQDFKKEIKDKTLAP